MNIAMISYHTCPLAILGGKDTGGMNVYVRDLTRELGRMGIHVDVFTRSQDEHVPHVIHELGFGNRVVHVPAGPEIPIAKQRLADFVPAVSRRASSSLPQSKGIRYDVMHSHYWLSGLAAEQLSDAWQGTPIVQMFHTLGEMKNRVARSEDERESPERIAAEQHLLARADRIIVSTLAEQTQLRFLYKANDRKLEIIPPGVDLTHFYPIPADEAKAFVGLKPDDRMVLFVGRIEPLKGVETLIRAMSSLKLQRMEAARTFGDHRRRSGGLGSGNDRRDDCGCSDCAMTCTWSRPSSSSASAGRTRCNTTIRQPRSR